MKWSVGTKIGGGFALALMTLILIGFASYRSTTELIDAAASRSHTYVVLQHLEGVLSILKDAETGQRGYIITGEERYLEPYHNVTRQTDQKIQELRRLTVDNAAQQRRLDTLEPLI